MAPGTDRGMGYKNFKNLGYRYVNKKIEFYINTTKLYKYKRRQIKTNKHNL